MPLNVHIEDILEVWHRWPRCYRRRCRARHSILSNNEYVRISWCFVSFYLSFRTSCITQYLPELFIAHDDRNGNGFVRDMCSFDAPPLRFQIDYYCSNSVGNWRVYRFPCKFHFLFDAKSMAIRRMGKYAHDRRNNLNFCECEIPNEFMQFFFICSLLLPSENMNKKWKKSAISVDSRFAEEMKKFLINVATLEISIAALTTGGFFIFYGISHNRIELVVLVLVLVIQLAVLIIAVATTIMQFVMIARQ